MIQIKYEIGTGKILGLYRDFNSKIASGGSFTGDATTGVLEIENLPNLRDLQDLVNFKVSGNVIIPK